MITVADIFCGGGGWSLGAKAAGIEPAWAIDSWDIACRSYRLNIGHHAICARVEDIDPATLPPVDILLASPPCQGASQARRKDLPAHVEADAGLAVVRYLEVLRPQAFLLENVPPYATTTSFKAIRACLGRLGYIVHYENVNAADYGVPQTRNRLILRAVRDSLLWPLPAPRPWVGWYAAIEDLLPGLPDTSFAPWQLARLAAMPEYSFLLMTGNTNTQQPTGTGVLAGVPPANTVTAASTATRACLVNYADNYRGKAVRMPEPPAFCTTGSSDGRLRAYLVSGTDSTVPHGTEPSVTVCATLQSKTGMPRAFLLDSTEMRTMPVRDGHAPSNTIRASGRMPRAFLVRNDNTRQEWGTGIRQAPLPATVGAGNGKGVTAFVVSGTPDDYGSSVCVRDAAEPIFTIQVSSAHQPARARASGHVVKLSLRCLARFQSIPDWYELPVRNSDAARLIGNAIPPRLAERLLEPFVASMGAAEREAV